MPIECRSSNLSQKNYDAIIIGGGSVAIHSADALRRARPDARILAITQDKQFGGLTDRSMEQFRQLHGTKPLAWMVDVTQKVYQEIEDHTGRPTSKNIPYVFIIGKEDPEKPDRPTRADYEKMIAATKSWGFDSQAEMLTPEMLRERYSFLDGDDVDGAVVIHNAGRLFTGDVHNELIRRSESNDQDEGVRFVTGVRGERILLDAENRVRGVQTALGDILETDNVIYAPGAHILDLPNLLPDVDVSNFISRFTVTQQELFYAPVDGLPEDTNMFLISPDGAYVRIERGEETGVYGNFIPENPKVTDPQSDPQPMKNQEIPLPLVVYDALAHCSTRYDPEVSGASTLSRRPTGQTAGYYTDYDDGLPVIGQLKGVTGLTIATGASHFGVMTGGGYGEIVAQIVFGGEKVPQTIITAVEPNRITAEEKSLVL